MSASSPLRDPALLPDPEPAPALAGAPLAVSSPDVQPATEDGESGATLRHMKLALEAARDASRIGEVPVGAVVVLDGQVLSVAHNERETAADPTAHAEIVALRRAAKARGGWRLTDAELYVTMEPCPMCAGALVAARLRRLIYGCDDPKAGAVRTLYRLIDDPRLNHRVEVVGGVLAAESAALLRSFFSGLRSR